MCKVDGSRLESERSVYLTGALSLSDDRPFSTVFPFSSGFMDRTF